MLISNYHRIPSISAYLFMFKKYFKLKKDMMLPQPLKFQVGSFGCECPAVSYALQ